jgi:hypothetical protein
VFVLYFLPATVLLLWALRSSPRRRTESIADPLHTAGECDSTPPAKESLRQTRN